MIYIPTHSTDPTWNLAAEEYAQKHLTQFPEIFMLWQNDNSIIVGRYQNMGREINADEARAKNVKVVRRSTGGGTVYHDLGNLNFSIIKTKTDDSDFDFAKASEPIVTALNAMGIPVVVSGRNDLLLNGKKISGTAQSVVKNRILHHGTLLFDSNMSVLQSVLNVDKTKLISKGIASVKSRVTNIKSEMGLDIDMDGFWKALMDKIDISEEYAFTEDDLRAIRKIQAEKYAAWDWNVGKEPAFDFTAEKRYTGGLLTLHFNVENGILKQCRISGDFLGLCDIGELQGALEGLEFKPENIKTALGKIKLSDYIGSITEEEFIDCMFSESCPVV